MNQGFLIVLFMVFDLLWHFLFQGLKKERAVLSDQVKLTMNSFPGPDILNTLQLISMSLLQVDW